MVKIYSITLPDVEDGMCYFLLWYSLDSKDLACGLKEQNTSVKCTSSFCFTEFFQQWRQNSTQFNVLPSLHTFLGNKEPSYSIFIPVHPFWSLFSQLPVTYAQSTCHFHAVQDPQSWKKIITYSQNRRQTDGNYSQY